MTAPSDPAAPTLAIGAIFKNEAPYILEWVAFHRVVGVERFFVADNNSDDESTPLLAGLQAIGAIDHIPFPHVPDSPPQMPAYVEILRRHGDDADWIAFIDADEFLVPSDPAATVADALGRLGDDVGVVGVNWASYGSSFRTDATPGLVTERFTWRATQKFGANHHYKSIVRVRGVEGVGKNPHAFPLKAGFVEAHPSGAPLAPLPKRPKGLSAAVEWAPLRLNHYLVKSRDEFLFKKSARGRATSVTKRRGEAYFNSHDRNDLEEAMSPLLIERTREEMARLKARLIEAGLDRAVVDVDLAVAEITARSGGRQPAPAPAEAPAARRRGSIGRTVVTPTTVTLQGWALEEGRGPIAEFALRVGDRMVPAAVKARIPRPDLARQYPRAPNLCGFRLAVDVQELGAEALLRSDVAVVAVSPGFDIAFSPAAAWDKAVEDALVAAGAPPLATASPETRAALIGDFVKGRLRPG